jgi:hypothetical protein
MILDTHMTEEMDLLLNFDPDRMQHGLVVQSDAAPALISVAAPAFTTRG